MVTGKQIIQIIQTQSEFDPDMYFNESGQIQACMEPNDRTTVILRVD